MEFNLASAKERVTRELLALADELAPPIQAYYEKNEIPLVRDKISLVCDAPRDIQETPQYKKYAMLYSLWQGNFWYATDDWPEVSQNLTPEDRKFYANYMLAEAEDAYGKHPGFTYAWIVKEYETGNLKEFVSDKLLEEAVNKGFWEFAIRYLASERNQELSESIWNYYHALMNHTSLIDTKKRAKFMKEPLRASWDWPDGLYLQFFEEIRGNLSRDQAAYFALPIVESLFKYVLKTFDPLEDPDGFLAKEIETYMEYVPLPRIQKLLTSLLRYDAEAIADNNYGNFHRRNVRVLRSFLEVPEEEFKRLVSSSIRIRGEDLANMLDNDMPIDWVNEQTRKKINKEMVRHAKVVLTGKNDIVPNLGLIQKAMKAEFMKEDEGKAIIREKLDVYLMRGRLPSAKAVVELLGTLNRRYVDERLYAMVEEKAKRELARRRNVNAQNKNAVEKIKKVNNTEKGNRSLESFSS